MDHDAYLDSRAAGLAELDLLADRHNLPHVTRDILRENVVVAIAVLKDAERLGGQIRNVSAWSLTTFRQRVEADAKAAQTRSAQDDRARTRSSYFLPSLTTSIAPEVIAEVDGLGPPHPLGVDGQELERLDFSGARAALAARARLGADSTPEADLADALAALEHEQTYPPSERNALPHAEAIAG